ncbi:MAG: hypothetical protein E6I48_14920 [Chloroflexi bacterium]|nr:MAG: hypothetical protein E6I48_14920 [Chloroflexota bacterium]
MIESPSGPTEAMTAFSLVPAGKFTTRVPGSAPNSTLRFVGVVEEEVWFGVVTSGCLGFEVIEGVFVSSADGVVGTARAIGTPITTTYINRNAPTKPRPYDTKSP